jgi:hypothetical protein
MSTEIDHLVVAAATLDEGARWARSTLGVEASPGGRHAAMGTHNLLLKLSSAAFPRCYLEIIAVDPEAPAPQRLRWFGLDDAALQARLKAEGPRLLHVVARSPMLETHRWGLANKGLNPGEVMALHRDTPHGPLHWQICVRSDGRLLADGVVPTLMQWDSAHPTQRMAEHGLALTSLRLDGLPAVARDLLRLREVQVDSEAPPRITAVVQTAAGPVTLQS